MNLEQMRFRCPNSEVKANIMLEGYELEFKGSKSFYATIKEKENNVVPVVLWEITKEDEMALDIYEGYPNFYRKEFVNIEYDGKDAEVMTYVMNAQTYGIPTERYINTIKEGYETAGFDTNLLYEFLAKSNMKIKKNLNLFEKVGGSISEAEIIKDKINFKKNFFKEGEVLELLEDMEGEENMPKGLRGEVTHVDDIGTIHMKWENGRTLGLTEIDSFKKIEGKVEEESQDLEIDNNQMDMF